MLFLTEGKENFKTLNRYDSATGQQILLFILSALNYITETIKKYIQIFNALVNNV